MRLSPRLVALARAGTLMAAIGVAGLIAATSPAVAGPAPGLCQMTTARGAIPSSFAVEACFDGAKLTLRNDIDVALGVVSKGDVGTPTRTKSDFGLAALATRLHSHDPNLLLPGDRLRFPIGTHAASARLVGSSASFYALATTIADFIPGKPNAVIAAFTTLVNELSADMAQYKNCLIGKNWLGQLGCETLRDRNVSFAIGRAGLSASAKTIVGTILSAATFSAWANAQPGQIKAILHSGSIRLSAVQPANVPAAPEVTTTQPTTTPQPAPAPSTPTQPTQQPLAIGSTFNDECVVAWPTAPVRTTASIEMTMSCAHVPESTYLFTHVIYNDPNLRITPNTGKIGVEGRVVDVARSEYGYKELVVQASNIQLP
jgi:hypothetical protein